MHYAYSRAAIRSNGWPHFRLPRGLLLICQKHTYEAAKRTCSSQSDLSFAMKELVKFFRTENRQAEANYIESLHPKKDKATRTSKSAV